MIVEEWSETHNVAALKMEERGREPRTVGDP